MRLTLATLRCPDSVPRETRSAGGGEFTLGRAPDNAWVLADPDRHLSKRHCVLAFRNGCWQIADTSTNGTFLNDEDTPIGPGVVRDLRDGDRIRLGAYEIAVGLAEATRPPTPAPDAARGAANPFDEDPCAPPRAAAPRAPEWRDEEPPLPAAPAQQAAQPPAAAAVGAADGALLAAFLRGAGVPDARLDDPTAAMEALGAAFRALVSGLRAVLIARAAIKGEFRIEQTLLRARGNNPLKFSADDEDALAALLGAGRRTAVPPAEAVAEALRDLRQHELASVAAMQTAVRALLAQLSPEAAQAAAGGGGLLPGGRKARAFEAFEAQHAALVRALSDDFDSAFGKAFARAYEAALRDAMAREEDA